MKIVVMTPHGKRFTFVAFNFTVQEGILKIWTANGTRLQACFQEWFYAFAEDAIQEEVQTPHSPLDNPNNFMTTDAQTKDQEQKIIRDFDKARAILSKVAQINQQQRRDEADRQDARPTTPHSPLNTPNL